MNGLESFMAVLENVDLLCEDLLHDLQFFDDVLSFDEDVPFDADVERFAKELFGGLEGIGADATDVPTKGFVSVCFALGLVWSDLVHCFEILVACGPTVLEMAELKRSTTSGR